MGLLMEDLMPSVNAEGEEMRLCLNIYCSSPECRPVK